MTSGDSPHPGGTVILSPHSDDAAFSIGGLIASRRLPQPVTLVTVFGKSNYATGLFHEDWRAVSARRRAEDGAFARRTGMGLEWLDFPEAGVRIAPSFDILFLDGPFPGGGEVAEPGLTAAIGGWLAPRLASRRPDLVLAPLGLGGHRDHLAVRAAALDATARSGVPLLFYEDLPYADEATLEAIQGCAMAVCQGRAAAAAAVLDEGLLQAKIANLGLYGSQMDGDVRAAVRRHAERIRPGTRMERLWGLAEAFAPLAGAEPMPAAGPPPPMPPPGAPS